MSAPHEMSTLAGPAEHLQIVLCWHMHQPDYRRDGIYLKPWTWLHAIKDYSDMAAWLEEIPQARAVVNFSPVLLLQIEDYAQRLSASLQQASVIGDRILDALASGAAAIPEEYETDLLQDLLRVNEERIRPRFPVYARLQDAARQALSEAISLPLQQLDDLLVLSLIHI